MRRITKLRPSPAMAVAFVALFVAGAGSAVAGGLLDGGDIKNNSLSSKDVKDHSLLKKDFKGGQLPRGKAGAQGPQGIAGPTGRAGRDGIDGFGELDYSQGVGASTANGETGAIVFAACPEGTFPTGGDAFYVDAATDDLVILPIAVQTLATDSDDNPAGWAAQPTENTTATPVQLVVDAICANADDIGFATTPQAKREGLRMPASGSSRGR